MKEVLILVFCLPVVWGCSRTGSITQPGSAGTQIVSFNSTFACKPKVVLFFYNNMTGDGGAANAAFGFGAGVSPSQRMSGFSISVDAIPTSNTDRALATNRAVVIIDSNQNIIASADIVSLDSDGVTLNWVVTDGVARVISFLGWGGADVTNAMIGSFTSSGTTQSITAPGFQPDLVIFYWPGPFTGTDFTQALGMATATDSWAIATGSANNQGFAISRRAQRTDKSLYIINGFGVANTVCTTAMTSTGFDQTCTTQGNQPIQYVAIKGGSYKLGYFNAPITSGNSVISGIGFPARALLLASFGGTSNISSQLDARASWGAGTSSTGRWSMWHGDTNGPTVMVSSQSLNRNAIFEARNEAGASPTTLASADLVNFSTDAFTLNWTADSIAREVLYLAIRTSEAGPVITAPISRRRIVRQ